MKAYINTNLPVFEADQVLSETDLNSIVSHLEEQHRMTRKNLIGIGISCGLDLDFSVENSVKISCGTAVTSMGFQINWAENTFINYHDIEISDQFLAPDFIKEPFLDQIFKYTSPYNSIKNCVELLPKNSGEEDEKPIPAGFFDNKVVVLLLEINLVDEKNCVTTNCDDKGKRLDFSVRPLLIPVDEDTTALLQEYLASKNYEKLAFPRYNVPFASNLSSPVLVLDGFRKVYDDALISDISAKISSIYDDYKSSLINADLPILQSVKTKINSSVNAYKSTLNIQYLWDWISDIVESYNEIVDFKELNPTLCCVDESLFPFHVVLGGNSDFENTFRTLFFKTANSDKKNLKKLKKLTILFERLAQIISSFQVLKTDEIKVTPSKYGSCALSKRSIPYYYNSVLDLNKKWNPDLTTKNQNDSILSYFSDMDGYSDKYSVQNPLEFDLEPYNFFRIEGHLGLNYKTAIEKITLIRNSNNLPFKITALNAADFFNKEVDISNFNGRWDDLETDYDLARKRVFNITEFVINWMTAKKTQLNSAGLIDNASIDNFKSILSQIKGLLTEDLMAFLPNCKSFNEIFKQLNLVFIYHRNCIQLLHPTLSSIAEDLIDYLDDINELFLDDPFNVLFEEATLRWQTIYKDLFFSTFVTKHPGFEHKAGVTKGGTFVLVYTDSSIFKTAKPPLTHLTLLTAVLNYKDNIPIEASVKEDLAKTVTFRDYKSQVIPKPNIEVLEKARAETDSIKNSLFEVANANIGTQFSPAVKKYLLGTIKAVLEYEPQKIPKNSIPEQVIIADFFLPYTCCSEGTTLEVKFETKQANVISLDPLKFCGTDENQYEIVLKGESGGVMIGTAKDAVVLKGGKFFLKPNDGSLKATKIYNLQYELSGELSNIIEFEIDYPIILSWSVSQSPAGDNAFLFTNSVKNDTHDYEIDFGDGSSILTTKENQVSHNFKFTRTKPQFEVTIKQLGETCPNQQNIIVKKGGDFNNADFNSADFNTN